MLLWQKQQIIEIIKTLGEAHKEAEKNLAAGDKELAIVLLGDCQDAAESIANIVANANVDRETEAYCEKLYRRSMGEEVNLDVSLDRLRRVVKKAEVKKEIVFMPYQASMWDSLESIYRAAEADERCECFVVVLPYYDKESDGTLKNLHYEGNLFPDYVPITDWRQYDMELRRPDVVYIHNPYDDSNLVTQIPEQFFSQSLKNNTTLLIYCPYFIHSKKISEHLALMPGVFYADRVIVQSEEIRAQYLKSIDQFHKKNNCIYDEKKFTKKIIALGSPKIDKVLNISTVEYNVSDALESFIVQARNSGKKIVLYNTSLEAMFLYTVEDGYYSNRYFQKLLSLFQFIQKREDVALLWRPHPLMEKSLYAMRQGVYEKYCELVELFKQKQIGFYDDGEDLYRVLKNIDFCYGDPSSVNLLLQAIGKPVFVQCVPMIDYNKELKSQDEIEEILKQLFSKQFYNSFIFYESLKTLTLSDFIQQFDVIGKYGAKQSKLYRNRFINADGTAGEKIFRYSMELLLR